MQAARTEGFAPATDEPLRVSNHADPLASPSIARFLTDLEAQDKVLCLVFDQFEELYSKPELFNVFEEAQRLFLSAVSACTSLALGFAWKTDSTVQQGHPAYFMWHRLADHRFEVCLEPFGHSEASTALTLYEKEIKTKLRPALRRQIIESSQGFPWLIKKLCVHLWEQISLGASQAELADAFDVASLFNRDLQALTVPEATCLKAIARSAPAGWYDILETYGDEVLRALQNRRLIVRSGDRLNLYWDIFKEYVLTQAVPSLPFTFLPSSPSIKALLAVAEQLVHDTDTSLDELAKGSSIGAGTVQNIIHDLLMFGVATGSAGRLRLDERVESPSAIHVLQRIRDVVRRHAFTKVLSRFDHGQVISLDDLIESLKSTNRASQHRARTWRLYAERIVRWLQAAGFIVNAKGSGWVYHDRGAVVLPSQRLRRAGVFLGEAPPAKALEALQWLSAGGPKSSKEIKAAGFRNAVSVLGRFGLVQAAEAVGYCVVEQLPGADPVEALWRAADSSEAVARVVRYLESHPNASRVDIAEIMRLAIRNEWTVSSKKRVGTGLWQWAMWVIQGRLTNKVPSVPKLLRRKKLRADEGPSLFDALSG